MSPSRPLFSVVLPTRNRAHLLRNALQSILEQTLGDFEIVVSDNASSDETPRVVEDCADRRVSYVRTPGPLSQADSWEFALDRARGEYVTFLGDDDALCPDVLAQVSEVLAEHRTSVCTWELGFYYDGLFGDPTRVNSVELCPFDRQVEQLDSRSTLSQLYSGFQMFEWQKWPNLQNAAYHRDVIARVKKRLGRFFHPLLTDISSCVATLVEIDDLSHIHDLLALKRFGRETFANMTFSDRERESNLRSEFGAEAEFRHVPLKSTTATNAIFETLLRMKEKLAPDLAHLEISWANYFISCYPELIRVDLFGSGDMPSALSSDLGEFERELAVQPPDVRERVRRALAHDRLDCLVSLDVSGRRFFIVRGADAGFSNVLECARFLKPSLRKELVRYWSGDRSTPPIEAEVVTKSPWVWGVAAER